MNPEFHFDLAYKYCDTATLPKIVKNGKLWFSRADTLNDTFELSPFLMPLDWNDLVELQKRSPEVAHSLVSTAFKRVISSLYVTCFSKHYKAAESQLMWAHYGNSHKGCCICIDFSVLKGKYSTDSLYPVEVQYVDSLLVERNRRTTNSDDLGMLIGATKQKVWEYEQEVRIVLESHSFDSTRFEYINDDRNVSVDFDPSCISKVVFGLKSSAEGIETVVKSFCDIGHLPEFTRLDINPLTLDVVEKSIGYRDAILTYNDAAQ